MTTSSLAARSRGPTQVGVAQLAGVSQATVSYIINDNAPITVPEVTRDRVLAAIAELGYVPDRAAELVFERLVGVAP